MEQRGRRGGGDRHQPQEKPEEQQHLQKSREASRGRKKVAPSQIQPQNVIIIDQVEPSKKSPIKDTKKETKKQVKIYVNPAKDDANPVFVDDTSSKKETKKRGGARPRTAESKSREVPNVLLLTQPILESKKKISPKIDPELIERALAFSHPELLEHRRLQSLDRRELTAKISKEKPHCKLS